MAESNSTRIQDNNSLLRASVVQTPSPTINALVVSNNDGSNILGSMNIGLYMYSSQLPATGKIGQYAEVLETSSYWAWNGTTRADTKQQIADISLEIIQGVLQILNQKIPALNTNIQNKLNVVFDTTAAATVYPYITPSNGSFVHNDNIHFSHIRQMQTLALLGF